MYIIVAGGGKVGRFLTESLVNNGYEVLLIEKMQPKVEQYTEQFGNVVVQGDACEAQVLSEAGAARADVVIAVTGDDEDNLVISQLAKRRFKVKRTIARVNNPKNERIFKKLGIDATVSNTEVIMNLIEEKIPSHALWHLAALRDERFELVAALIGPTSSAANKTLGAVKLPENCRIVQVLRDGKMLVPAANLVLAINDEVIAIVERRNERETDLGLRQLLVGDQE